MSEITVGSEWQLRSDADFVCAITSIKYYKNDHILIDTDLSKDNRYGMHSSFTKGVFTHYFEPKERTTKDDSSKPKHSHYHKDVSDYDTIDIYVICDLYVNDNSGCIQHAVKKLLCCGNRGVKDNVKDLQEAIDTIQRKIEILQGKSE